MTFWQGDKTITIRDISPTLKAGAMCYVGWFEDDGYFTHNRSDRNVNCDAGYAEQKTCATGKYMSLDELKRVIAEIYPNQTQFYVIDF